MISVDGHETVVASYAIAPETEICFISADNRLVDGASSHKLIS
jgi:hypothetical protein